MKRFDVETPEFGTLVLVWFGDFDGWGIRSFTEDGDAYDEHEILDDSEIEPLLWTDLPEPVSSEEPGRG